ncbi:MAG: tyrosine decarboxylase MfnA [Candidatus Methanospirare jalkutatii]|nr:MAG: tyrosine decarboxylase MfnA [Candidatus Methanospirare jalkutatii]
MEERGLSEEEVLSLLEEKKRKDLKYERIFSSMCSYPHKIAVKAHMKFLEANLGDSGIFAGTKEMEDECIEMIARLFHAENAHGYISTGGTESNIQAIRAFRNLKRKEWRGSPKEGEKMNIVVPASAHFSFDKIADILDIEVRKASLDDELKVDLSDVEALIDRNTIGLVGIAGTTEFGQIDPIGELGDIALRNDIFLHVDAAFGGFVIPFLEKKYDFDFAVEGVSSLAADPHKMLTATIPAGCILFRERRFLESLAVETPYLTTKTQFSLTGTRSGAAVAATFSLLKFLGREGMRRIVRECMRLTEMLVERCKTFGVHPVLEPVMNVVALNVPHAEGVSEALKRRGWITSVTREPKALRLVIMPHITESILSEFLADLKAVLA